MSKIEETLKIYQEVYDKNGRLVEIHEKYPADKGGIKRQKEVEMTLITKKKSLADMLIKYINRQTDPASLVSWSEDAMREADFENSEFFEIHTDIWCRPWFGIA